REQRVLGRRGQGRAGQRGQQRVQSGGQSGGRGLVGEQGGVVGRGALDRLRGVVDQDVEARAGGVDVGGEGLDAGDRPQVEREDLQALAKTSEVGVGGEAARGVAG